MMPPTLAQLLPVYESFARRGNQYKAIETFVIDGHEVVWAEQTNAAWPAEQSVRRLLCQCHFTQGVGWRPDKDFKVVGLTKADHCQYRQLVVEQAQTRLRNAYQEQYGHAVAEHIEEIVFDLIDKVKQGVLLEGSNGAAFWGGHFYVVSTLFNVTGLEPSVVWEAIGRMVRKRLICLEGSVVQDYRAEAEAWDKVLPVAMGEWEAVAEVPRFDDMKLQWRFQFSGPDGQHITEMAAELPLDHASHFDVTDKDYERCQAYMKQRLTELINSQPSELE